MVAEYQNDPLVHRHVSTRWYTSFVEAQAAANAEPEAIQVPMLWVISGGDRLCHAGWNQEFSGKLPATSTEVKLFPDAFHEAHNGPDKAKVIAAMVAWLKTQTAA